MSKFIGQDMDAAYQLLYDSLFGVPHDSSWPAVYSHGAYYIQYHQGRRIPRALPRVQGLDNPNVTIAADDQRHTLAYSAALFQTQRDVSTFPADYLGPRPQWWWTEYAASAGPRWFSGFTKNVLNYYPHFDKMSFLPNSTTPVRRYTISSQPDNNYGWIELAYPPHRLYDHDTDHTTDSIVYIQHDSVTLFELPHLIWQLITCTATGNLQIHGIAGLPDITLYTWNAPPSLGPLLAEFPINGDLPAQYVDPQGYLTFAVSIDFDSFTPTPGQDALLRAKCYPLQLSG